MEKQNLFHKYVIQLKHYNNYLKPTSKLLQQNFCLELKHKEALKQQ